MQIKEAQIDDLHEILDLQKLCYHENAVRYNDFYIPPLMETIEELKNDFRYSIILKAVEDSHIIGSVRGNMKNDTCFIGRLVVHPQFQNKGIGRQLMSAIENQFSAVNRYELFTGFRDDKNLYIYNKMGYKEFKQVKINEDLTFIYLEKLNTVCT